MTECEVATYCAAGEKAIGESGLLMYSKQGNEYETPSSGKRRQEYKGRNNTLDLVIIRVNTVSQYCNH